MYCLQETFSKDDDEKIWSAEWGGQIIFSHGSEHSRGVCILLSANSGFSLNTVYADRDGQRSVMAVGCVLSSSPKSNKFLALLLFILFLYGTQKCSAHREGDQRILTGLLIILPQNSSDIYRTRSWATPEASSGRRKSYLASRILYIANDTRTQQLSRIILGGDIHKNPGPTEKRSPKYPCKECGKGVRSNQDALLWRV